MAMRRRSFTRFRGRPGSFRRRSFGRSGKFAKQKFDKIVLINNLTAGPILSPTGFQDLNGNSFCNPFEIPGCSAKLTEPDCGPATTCGLQGEDTIPCKCCVTRGTFVLVNNDTLESYFQDSVTIVRMYGDIFYRAVVASPFNSEFCTIPGSQLRNFNEVFHAAYAEQWNWSLRKHLRTQSNDETLAVDNASPMFSYDWTESSPPWLWQRSSMWFPRATRTFLDKSYDSLLGVCSNSAQPGYVVPPTVAGANPGWIVPAAATVCTPSGPAESGVCLDYYNGLNITEAPWHRMRFSSKKHIKMVRDQDLILGMNVRHPSITVAGGWPCLDAATVFPGFPRGGDVSYQVFMRIAATVRLN